jgi:hypothetical protein
MYIMLYVIVPIGYNDKTDWVDFMDVQCAGPFDTEEAMHEFDIPLLSGTCAPLKFFRLDPATGLYAPYLPE